MSRVMLRFAYHGCANRPFFHLIAVNRKRPRNGPVLEQLGTYDPMPNVFNEKVMAINFERLRAWLVLGAQPTLPVEMLLGVAGFYPIHPRSIMAARRKRRIAEEEAAAALAAEEAEATTGMTGDEATSTDLTEPSETDR